MATTNVIRYVDQGTAKKGRFIRSFNYDEFAVMVCFVEDMIKTAKRMKVRGEFVYTTIPFTNWKGRTSQTYQVYLILEG